MKFWLIVSGVVATCTMAFGATDLISQTLHKPDSCSRAATKGDMLTMHYRGTVLNGDEFDSSYPRGEPFKFQLGIGQVIKGWDDGLIGICPGEKRKLTIPPELGYGDMGAGDKIPPKSTLVFEVECVAVDDGPAPVNVFKEIDLDNDKQLTRQELAEYLRKQVPEGVKVEDVPDHDKLIDDIFKHEDADENGVITHEEFSGPKHDEL